MQHLNSVLLEGVLVDDPRLVIDNGNNRMAKISLASDRFYISRDGQKCSDTLFIPVQFWGGIADKAMEKLSKGTTVRVVGRLRMSRWTADDGLARSAIEIVADHVEFRSKLKGSKSETIDATESDNGEAVSFCLIIIAEGIPLLR